MNQRISKCIFVAASIMITTTFNRVLSQESPYGIFDNHSDIGRVNVPGLVSYSPGAQEYSITGSGKNIWFSDDEFHYLWKKAQGDFILTATVEFIGQGVEPHRKIGWMIRESLDTGSAHVSAVVHGDGLTSLQFRRKKSENMDEVKSAGSLPDIVQLERRGNTYIMSVATYGEPFITSEISDIQLSNEVFVGLFVCSHNPMVSENAVFRNVRITVPAPDSLIPYKDYIGSNLEIMDIETGNRRIIHQDKGSIQAPNWTPNGKTLIYNKDGLLYSFDIATNVPSKINTGFATNNNNDHVLSPDGKLIGISHHSVDDEGKSIIYILPTTGGKPNRVTPNGPSYLHGWSPDGKFLFYTAGRNNQYDIYKIPAEGGEEIRLTTAEGLDDGSEYSTIGKYVYFNSNRTGTMKIWRMKPDGSKQEQITFDEYNDWFPHFSPDGKWIVFLSFMPDINSGDHPFYKHVYIRMMPAAGGQSRVVAYLYGGQGTINVPSWSPDSKKIAFVSNSVLKE